MNFRNKIFNSLNNVDLIEILNNFFNNNKLNNNLKLLEKKKNNINNNSSLFNQYCNKSFFKPKIISNELNTLNKYNHMKTILTNITNNDNNNSNSNANNNINPTIITPIPIYCICFSDDDDIFFTGDNNGLIKIFSTKTGQLIDIFNHHSSPVNDLIYYNNFLISCSEDQTVNIYNINSLELINTYEFDESIIRICGYDYFFNNKNKKIILVCSQSGKIYYINLDFLNFNNNVNNFDSNNNSNSNIGKFYFDKKIIEIYNLKKVRSIELKSISFNNSIGIIVCGYNDGLISVWDINSILNYSIIKKKFILEFNQYIFFLDYIHDSTVHIVEFNSNNNDYFLTGGVDGLVLIWYVKKDVISGIRNKNFFKKNSSIICIYKIEESSDRIRCSVNVSIWSKIKNYVISIISSKPRKKGIHSNLNNNNNNNNNVNNNNNMDIDNNSEDNNNNNNANKRTSALIIYSLALNKIIRKYTSNNSVLSLNDECFILESHPIYESIILTVTGNNNIILFNFITGTIIKKFKENNYFFSNVVNEEILPAEGKFSLKGDYFVISTYLGFISIYSIYSRNSYLTTNMNQFLQKDFDNQQNNINNENDNENIINLNKIFSKFVNMYNLPYIYESPYSYYKLNQINLFMDSIVKKYKITKKEIKNIYLKSNYHTYLKYFNKRKIECIKEEEIYKNSLIDNNNYNISSNNNNNNDEANENNNNNEDDNSSDDDNYNNNSGGNNSSSEDSYIESDKLSEEDKMVIDEADNENNNNSNNFNNRSRYSASVNNNNNYYSLRDRSNANNNSRSRHSNNSSSVYNINNNNNVGYSLRNRNNNIRNNNYLRTRFRINNNHVDNDFNDNDDDSFDDDNNNNNHKRRLILKNRRRSFTLETNSNQNNNLINRNNNNNNNLIIDDDIEINTSNNFNNENNNNNKNNNFSDSDEDYIEDINNNNNYEDDNENKNLDENEIDKLYKTAFNEINNSHRHHHHSNSNSNSLNINNNNNSLKENAKIILNNLSGKKLCFFCNFIEEKTVGPFCYLSEENKIIFSDNNNNNNEIYIGLNCLLNNNDFIQYKNNNNKFLLLESINNILINDKICYRCGSSYATKKCNSCSKYFHGNFCIEKLCLYSDKDYKCLECYRKDYYNNNFIENQNDFDNINVDYNNIDRTFFFNSVINMNSYFPQLNEKVYFILQPYQNFLIENFGYIIFSFEDINKKIFFWEDEIEFYKNPFLCEVVEIKYEFLNKNSLFILKEIYGKKLKENVKIIIRLKLKVINENNENNNEIEIIFLENSQLEFIIRKDIYDYNKSFYENNILNVFSNNNNNNIKENILINIKLDEIYQQKIIKIENFENNNYFKNSLYNSIQAEYFSNDNNNNENNNLNSDKNENEPEFLSFWEIYQENFKFKIEKNFNQNLIYNYLNNLYIKHENKLNIFYFKVDEIKDSAYNYYNIIEVPMFLELIFERLKNNYYLNKESFLFDFNLLLNNAIKYNKEESEVVLNAKKLFNKINNKIQEMFNNNNNNNNNNLNQNNNEKNINKNFVGKKKKRMIKEINIENLDIIDIESDSFEEGKMNLRKRKNTNNNNNNSIISLNNSNSFVNSNNNKSINLMEDNNNNNVSKKKKSKKKKRKNNFQLNL